MEIDRYDPKRGEYYHPNFHIDARVGRRNGAIIAAIGALLMAIAIMLYTLKGMVDWEVIPMFFGVVAVGIGLTLFCEHHRRLSES